MSGVLTQTIWSTLTLATQINTNQHTQHTNTGQNRRNNTNSKSNCTLRQNKIIDITHRTTTYSACGGTIKSLTLPKKANSETNKRSTRAWFVHLGL